MQTPTVNSVRHRNSNTTHSIRPIIYFSSAGDSRLSTSQSAEYGMGLPKGFAPDLSNWHCNSGDKLWSTCISRKFELTFSKLIKL
jgi:hypothetical protein